MKIPICFKDSLKLHSTTFKFNSLFFKKTKQYFLSSSAPFYLREYFGVHRTSLESNKFSPGTSFPAIQILLQEDS